MRGTDFSTWKLEVPKKCINNSRPTENNFLVALHRHRCSPTSLAFPWVLANYVIVTRRKPITFHCIVHATTLPKAGAAARRFADR